LQQDTHFNRCAAAVCRLVAGNITDPVVIRAVHSKNRMTNMAEHEQYYELWWSCLRERLLALDARREVMQIFRKAYARFRAERGSRILAVKALTEWVIREPREILIEYSHFDLVLRRIFDEKRPVLRLLSIKNRIIRTLQSGSKAES
jgi:hypothetical protein